jgi:glycosyltransferase involved in cell wall biosynthesis
MSEYVHIVALDAPSPPDYGGAIDINHKIVALDSIGKKVILHYFDYKEGRQGANGLEKYCVAIYPYKRQIGWRTASLRLPYIVQSRINLDLVARLNQDDHPIILEGIHCSGILNYLKKKDRKVVIRLHNDEARYYRALAETETKLFKKTYFLIESHLLKRFQDHLPSGICLAALSSEDIKAFGEKGFTNVHFIPSFLPWQQISSTEGKGKFCLYHGNLSVSENEKVALWLIDHVFSQCSIPLTIAGKGISPRLKNKAKNYQHILLVDSPSNVNLEGLLQAAHVNVLPSFNTTGVKLKLIHALFSGRYCVTNSAGVAGSELEDCVIASENAKEMIEKINHLFSKPFTKVQIEERKTILRIYNNEVNAKQLSALIS